MTCQLSVCVNLLLAQCFPTLLLLYLFLLTMFVALADKQGAEYIIKQQMVCASQRTSLRVKMLFLVIFFYFAFPLYFCTPSICAPTHTHTHTRPPVCLHTHAAWHIEDLRHENCKAGKKVASGRLHLASSSERSWVLDLTSEQPLKCSLKQSFLGTLKHSLFPS